MMLYAIVKSLLIPPGVISLLLLTAFFLIRGVMARLLVLAAFTVLTLMSLPAVSTSLMQPLEPFPPLAPESLSALRGPQAIVVLGAGRRTDAAEYGGDTLDDISLRRVRYAAFLHRETGLPIYVTGGRFPGEEVGLGRLMAETLATEYGIRVAAVEDESRTTWENATMTVPLLSRDGVGRILLVSDAWHLPRAVETFEQVGLEVTPAPTARVHREGWADDTTYADWLPSIRALSVSAYAIHEHLGRVWYQIRRWTGGDPAPGSGAAGRG